MTGGLHRCACPGELIVRPDENPYLGGCNSVGHGLLDPIGYACDFALVIGVCLDFGIGAVEHGHRSAPILLVAINVLYELREEAVRGLSDLAGGDTGQNTEKALERLASDNSAAVVKVFLRALPN